MTIVSSLEKNEDDGDNINNDTGHNSADSTNPW